MNQTDMIDFRCRTFYDTCMEESGYVNMFTIFAPSLRGSDRGTSVLSYICTTFTISAILFCHLKGNYWFTERENKALISNTEKKCAIALSVIIAVFEVIYVNAEDIYGAFVPSSSVYCWIINNGMIFMTLCYAQIFKDHFKIGIYMPYIMYQCTLLCMLVIRITSDSYFNNYDVLLIFVFASYSGFHAYSIPKCFLIDNERMRYITSHGSLTGRGQYRPENQDDIEMEEVSH